MYLPGRQADDTLGVLGPTEAHRACHHSIFQDLGKHRKTQSKCTEREAIQELLQSTVSYAGDENLSTVRSYERDLVSLPNCGAEPVSLEQVMDPEGREFLEDPQASMMLNEDEWGKICEHGNNFKPYMDEILQKDRIKYRQFVHDLYDKGMSEFTDTPQDMVTPFFVKKKDGRQRFILDCRGVNKRFQAPPPLALAAGSSWSQVVVPKDEILYCAQSDIKDYFYSLALPLKLRSLFCLPPVDFDLMQEWGVASHLRACNSVDGWIWPRLRVIPMGWSWAMWISQRVHSHLCLQATGLDHSRFLVEGQPAPCLEEGEVALLPYADNLNVLGIDRGKVQETKDRIVTYLRSLGFRVHEELEATCTFQSLGFYIDGKNGVVTPIPERLDKVVRCFIWLSKRPRVSGKAVEKLLGHCTHFCMLRRELLSMFRTLYDFMQHSYHKRSRLWESCAKEARWASHLLKLCVANLRRPWSQTITASDASLSGLSVSRRELGVEQQK